MSIRLVRHARTVSGVHLCEIVVDDSVENLLDLFETQSYEITVDDTVSDDLRERLGDRYDASDFAMQGDSMVFEATILGDQFYDLVDDIRDAGLSVESFDSVELDLEDIFLQVTDEGSETLSVGSHYE